MSMSLGTYDVLVELEIEEKSEADTEGTSFQSSTGIVLGGRVGESVRIEVLDRFQSAMIRCISGKLLGIS